MLLVEDDEDLRAALADFLRDEGYSVTCFGRCREALAALRGSDPFHLLLTDLKLPDGDGLDLIKAARERNEAIVGAVMTGYASLETALAAIRLGAYDYVTKPFNFDEIEILVHNMSDKFRLMAENRRIRERLDQLTKGLEDLGSVKVEMAGMRRATREGLDELARRLDLFMGGGSTR